jgi:hypothetical protein
MSAEPDSPIVTCYREALPPIRDSVGAVLKIAYADFDQLAGWSDGMAGKIFGASQVRRLGIQKFFDALRAAGLRIRYEEDPEQTAKMLELVAKKDYEPRNDRQARMNNRSNLSNKLVDEVLNHLAEQRHGQAVLIGALKKARSNRSRRSAQTAAQKRKQQQADGAKHGPPLPQRRSQGGKWGWPSTAQTTIHHRPQTS